MIDSNGRILVVDDDVQLSRTVCDILRIHGYDSVATGSGGETLELVSHEGTPFPVALIDLKLPDMNGLDLVRHFHERMLQTEVIILTGNASFDSAVAALRGRSCDYLVKPVVPDRLLDTVRRGMRLWHHHRAEERLRHDRERFQQMVESLSDIVVVLTPDHHIEYLSPSAASVIRYGPGDLQGEPFLQFVRDRQRQRVATALHDAGSDAGAARSFEFLLRRSDGEWRLLEAVARSLGGELADGSVVLTCRDVTDRRRLEEELLQSQKLESIGRLAGGVAHDFNNQLTAIMNAVELASWVPDAPQAVRTELDEIRLAAERAASLTRQLLIFSRKDLAEPINVDVSDVVRGILEMLRRLIPEHITIRTDLRSTLPPVYIDRTQLEQVVLNLVVNARDAMPDGGQILLRTDVRTVDAGREAAGLPAGDHVVLEVSDQGTGMSKEIRSRMFEPFFTTKEQARGTGLGLATCFGIVKRALGRIEVTSDEGRGSAFQVVLPVSTLTDPAGAPDKIAPASRDRQRGDETILVVEDDDGVRHVLERILASRGYTVLAATGGSEALDIARGYDGTIDLLISDLIMPEMKGPEVARAILQARPDVEVLFMSGYADHEVLDLLKPFSGADMLGKPASASEILARVRTILDR